MTTAFGFTPEHIAAVAKWLGYDWLIRDGGGMWRVGSVTSNSLSDADLFCAIDDKCFAEKLYPTMTSTGSLRAYQIDNVSAVGSTRLEAAISAVLKLIEDAP